jgi:hypothetical protein
MMRLITTVLAMLALSIGATAADLSCVVSQVSVSNSPEPSQVPGGPVYRVVVTAVPTYRSDCPNTTKYDDATGTVAIHPTYLVERRDSSSGFYEGKRSFQPAIALDGNVRSRRSVALETLLPTGSYRVRIFDGRDLLESLPFACGSVVGDFVRPLPFAQPVSTDDRSGLAYGQPSAVLRAGVLYFRGFNPASATASGYLFQDKPDGSTSVVPVTFESSDGSYGALGVGGDLLQMSAKLPPVAFGTFDAGLPVLGCVRTSAGSTCFPVFDPTVPYRDFNPNSAPFGGVH